MKPAAGVGPRGRLVTPPWKSIPPVTVRPPELHESAGRNPAGISQSLRPAQPRGDAASPSSRWSLAVNCCPGLPVYIRGLRVLPAPRHDLLAGWRCRHPLQSFLPVFAGCALLLCLLAWIVRKIRPNYFPVDHKPMFEIFMDIILVLPRITLAVWGNYSARQVPTERELRAAWRLLQAIGEMDHRKMNINQLPLEIPKPRLRARVVFLLQLVGLVDVRRYHDGLWLVMQGERARRLVRNPPDQDRPRIARNRLSNEVRQWIFQWVFVPIPSQNRREILGLKADSLHSNRSIFAREAILDILLTSAYADHDSSEYFHFYSAGGATQAQPSPSGR